MHPQTEPNLLDRWAVAIGVECLFVVTYVSYWALMHNSVSAVTATFVQIVFFIYFPLYNLCVFSDPGRVSRSSNRQGENARLYQAVETNAHSSHLIGDVADIESSGHVSSRTAQSSRLDLKNTHRTTNPPDPNPNPNPNPNFNPTPSPNPNPKLTDPVSLASLSTTTSRDTRQGATDTTPPPTATNTNADGDGDRDEDNDATGLNGGDNKGRDTILGDIKRGVPLHDRPLPTPPTRVAAIPKTLRLLTPYVEHCTSSRDLGIAVRRILNNTSPSLPRRLGFGRSEEEDKRGILSDMAVRSGSGVVVRSRNGSMDGTVITPDNINSLNTSVPPSTILSRHVWLEMQIDAQTTNHSTSGENKEANHDGGAVEVVYTDAPEGYTMDTLQQTKAAWNALPLTVKLELYGVWLQSLTPPLMSPHLQQKLRDLVSEEGMDETRIQTRMRGIIEALPIESLDVINYVSKTAHTLATNGISRDDVARFFSASIFTTSTATATCYQFKKQPDVVIKCHDGPGFMFKSTTELKDGEVVEALEELDGWLHHAKGWSVLEYQGVKVFGEVKNPSEAIEACAVSALLFAAEKWIPRAASMADDQTAGEGMDETTGRDQVLSTTLGPKNTSDVGDDDDTVGKAEVKRGLLEEEGQESQREHVRGDSEGEIGITGASSLEKVDELGSHTYIGSKSYGNSNDKPGETGGGSLQASGNEVHVSDGRDDGTLPVQDFPQSNGGDVQDGNDVDGLAEEESTW